MTAALEDLVACVDGALADASLATDRARADRIRPSMAALLAASEPIPTWAEEPYEGGAVGNLLHADPGGRYHVLAVVFPEGTSSGVHHHGCWGVIGYLRGGDEETRYVERPGTGTGTDGGGAGPVEASRHVWHQGDVTYLLPEDGEGWHRVRNPGPGTGVSVHVLCRTPADHPHLYWDREHEARLDFPFVEVAPDRWVAEVAWP
jgi:predicted metal-dependent enzyme (double-stranded beta helix superfamily)